MATVQSGNRHPERVLQSARSEKLTSEWVNDKWIVEIPFAAAAALASPCNVTSGTPASFGRISISFIAAPAPLEETPSDLNTASLPTQRAANDARKDGWARQYAISASVKLREMKVWFSVGTEDINSASDCQPPLKLPRKFENAP